MIVLYHQDVKLTQNAIKIVDIIKIRKEQSNVNDLKYKIFFKNSLFCFLGIVNKFELDSCWRLLLSKFSAGISEHTIGFVLFTNIGSTSNGIQCINN